MERKGIDVSRWQGNINFNKVKQSGIDFVIIKCGGSDDGFYTDKKFYTNYANAIDAGLHVGTYYFAGANCNSYENGVIQANECFKIIQGMKFDYPVIIDFEVGNRNNKIGNTNACAGFCDFFENLHYYAMIYASDISGFKERLQLNGLTRYDKWVARYGSKPKYVQKFGIWQYSSNGNVAGINGRVDMDISYNDYPSIIKRNHLNGF